MATFYPTNTTAIRAGGVNNKLLGGLIDARVKTFLDIYTIAGTEAAASLIDIAIDGSGVGVLPVGANVVGIILNVSAAQAALTVSVGDGASATRYGSALTSLQAAGTYLIGGLNYVVGTATGDRFIRLTTAGATMTAGTLRVAILYTLD